MPRSRLLLRRPARLWTAARDVLGRRAWPGLDVDLVISEFAVLFAFRDERDAVGSEWYYLVPDIHFSKQVVRELIPGERVRWDFTDGYLSFIADKKEWVGTSGRFDIQEKGGRTEVTFTHEGLASGDECYDVCFDAWTHYITVSLRQRIETGAGQIRTREEDARAVAQA